MKAFYLVLTFSFFAISIFSQNNTPSGIMPESYYLDLPSDDIDHIQVIPPSKELIAEEDKSSDKDGTMYRIGRLMPVNLTTDNSGSWDYTEDGRQIWRLRISSKGARSCALHFDYFKLKKNSQLYVYNTNYDVVLGPFSSLDNPQGWEYSIGVLYGDDIIIEYILPGHTVIEKGSHENDVPGNDFKISAYSYIYRGEYLFFETKATGYGTSGECEVNVNCPEGNNWRVQQRGIARIYAIDGYYAGYCSGSLINNTSNDLTPYILTANHCGTNSTDANFRQWRFDFNYESHGCVSYQEPQRTSFTGCVKKSGAPLQGGSDFLLVQMNATPQQIKDANLVYNGWKATNNGSTRGVCIHHPSGDIKKISTYNSNLTTTTYRGREETGASNAHWSANWTRTTNGYGVTEGGSSGSPIFDNEGYIIGTLSGGLSQCDYPSGADLFGKMSYHWDLNGNSAAQSLKPWLDPNNTYLTVCEHLDPNRMTFADFSTPETWINTGTSIRFTDMSESHSTINSRSWSFPGGTPSYSTAINPVITYNTAGTYDVTLTIATSDGSFTETKNGYITVYNNNGLSDFTYDFEECVDFAVDLFSPFTTYDGDHERTYGTVDYEFENEGYTGSFIAFNGTASVPPAADSLSAHQGLKYGACFSAINTPNNDWFISPKIKVEANSNYSFWAKSATAVWGLERFRVLVSTTNNNIPSFTRISEGSFTQAPVNWTKFAYDLSAYNGQSIYIAIQCISDDSFAFMIDDIELKRNTYVPDNEILQNLNIYPNPTDGIFNVSYPENNFTVRVFTVTGKEIRTLLSVGYETFIDLSDCGAGIYFISVETRSGKATKRVSVL